jgi:type IV secretory pathway VirB2 component (pilin)
MICILLISHCTLCFAAGGGSGGDSTDITTAGSGVTTALCFISGIMQGPLVQALAIGAICVFSIMALVGKLMWTTLIIFVVAFGVAVTSDKIVTALTKAFGNNIKGDSICNNNNA